MSWNTKPQRATMPPPYRNIQPAFSLQYVVNQFSTTSPSSFPCPASNQEGFSYLNSHTNSHTALPNMSSLGGPLQIPASNLPSRTVVASQTSVERAAHTNAKGPTEPSHNLHVASGVTQNPRLNSSMMSSMPSHTEAAVSHQTRFGTNPANSHMLQGQHTASDSCTVQLQVTPNSARVPGALQGSQGLQQPLPGQQLDWPPHHASDELMFSDHRPLPKQHSYSGHGFMQDPSILKSRLMPSAPSQVTYSQLPASAQSTQAAGLSCQYALQTSTRLPQYCRYKIQSLPNAQYVIKQLSVDVPQSPETVSSEVKKDFCQGFQQQWQSTNENVSTLGNVYDIKGDANVKQPFSEPVRTVDGVQAHPQSCQEKRMDSCNPTSRQGLDTVVTKEKLARDIKSLIEMKKKFSELARKIKINNALLKAAGCKPVSSLSGEPAQHTEFAVKESSTKSHCSMELVKTCLSLWKDKPSKTEEKASEPAGGKQANESVTSASAGVSKPLEVPIQNPCSAERNAQNKTANPLQAATLSMLVQNYEPLCTNVTKGSELQIAVVSPLILSNVINEMTPGTLPEAVYPVIKEGSICSLQNPPTEHAVVTAALNVDVIAPVVNPASARVFPVMQKEKHEPHNGNLQDTPGAHDKQGCHLSGLQTWPKPNNGTLVSDDLLQIENICSLVEGDKSYNSNIAKMFHSSPLKTVEPPKLDVPSQQVFHSGQHKKVEQGAESRGDRWLQCTDLLRAAAVESKKESAELLGSSSVKPVESRIPVGSSPERPPENVGTPSDAFCCPAAEPDINSGDIDTSGSDLAHPAAASGSHDHAAFCLQDQLSELLKEFPYGMESLNSYEESFRGQKKTEKVSEDQTVGKVGFDAQGSTEQIKITILSSEQMKELFPEQDEPQDINALQSTKVNKPAEPLKQKQVAEVGSQCEPQNPVGGESPGFEENTDQIHCCALGWLAMIYEGVPKCRCNVEEVAKKEAGQEQALLESSSCQPGQQTSDADVTLIKFDGVSPNPRIPLAAAAAEKRQSPKIPGSDLKDASKTRKDSAPRRLELPGQLPPKCKSSDRKDAAEAKQEALTDTGQEGMTGQLPSQADQLESSQRLKGVKLKWHAVHFQPSSKMSSDQASQEGPQKKHTVQSSNPSNPKEGLVPDTYRKNGSLPPEKKKLKLKESSPQEGHLEKRKLEQGEMPSLEIKKKRYNKGEPNKNAEVTPRLCATSPHPLERAVVKEDSTLNVKSSDFRHTKERSTVRDKTASQAPSMDAKDPRERASIPERAASQAQVSEFKDPRERAAVRDRVALQMQSFGAMDARERATVKDKIIPQMPSLDVRHTSERASVKEPVASQASDFKDARERATVRDKSASQVQSLDARDAKERATVRDKAGSQVQSLDARDARERATVTDKAASQVQSLDARDARERATVRDKMAPQIQAAWDAKDARQRTTVKEQPTSQIQASDTKDGFSNSKKVITLQEYYQRRKQNTAAAHTAKKICFENVSGNSTSTGSTRLHAQPESCRRLNDKGGSSIETSKVCTNHGKDLKAHLSETSKACNLSHVEGRLDGKQRTTTKSDKNLSQIGNEMPPQLKEQRKSYLNRVSFRCTERERICLTTLNSSSRKLGKDEKSQEHKPKASIPGQSSAVKPSLLEFKLCPDVLLQNGNTVEDKSDVKAHSEEQVAMQVSGIKSSRKDWIQCVTEKKSMQEADQEIGVNSRLLQRSASADGRELQQNAVKDSKAMFQTYKQLYLQKRGRSLGSSPGP
ncbi:uncharacterized protein KIAA1551 homolog isoform X2 [Octodon degus]|uniref:Uncharacterized protein KIAA1551 homolog isoform X2 n=1 Tax=Octodon degus TaxID=10160 RepID=A0A6P6EJ01_OCTDE|nr:uncharacterized protein KIAA1551 homolog isoform X2 [Octodon degus]